MYLSQIDFKCKNNFDYSHPIIRFPRKYKSRYAESKLNVKFVKLKKKMFVMFILFIMSMEIFIVFYQDVVNIMSNMVCQVCVFSFQFVSCDLSEWT